MRRHWYMMIVSAWVMWDMQLNGQQVEWQFMQYFADGESDVWSPEEYCKSLKDAMRTTRHREFADALICLPRGQLPPGIIKDLL